MKTRIISIGLGLAALLFTRPAPAAVSVVGWWHFGEGATTQAGTGAGTNVVNYQSAFTAGPNQPLVPPVVSTEAVGGPLGTNSGTNFSFSTSSLRFGLNASQSSFWNTTTNPPASNYGLELWFLPQNKGVTGGSVTWVFSTGGGQVGIPGGGPWGGEVVRLQDNFDGTSSLQAGVITGPNSADVVPFGPLVLVDVTRWIHLALVNNNGTLVFYTNGVPCATNDTGISFPAAGAMYIGTDGDNLAIDGFIDEERLFTFTPGQFSTNDLLLRPLPSIVVQPAANTTVWNGGAASLIALASRDPANTFQWRVGTNPPAVIGGQTSNILYLPLVTSASNGNIYSCVVSNSSSAASLTTSNATLAVAPVQTNNVNAYRSVVTGESGLVAFFPMDGSTDGTISNIVDNSHNGVLELNAEYDSRTNRSFGERALMLNGDGDVQVPGNPAYEFGGGNGTLEALIYLTTPVIPGYVAPFNATIFSVASSDGLSVRYKIQASSDGNTLIYTNDTPVQLTWAVPTSLLNRFAHVAFVFSNTTNVTAYVDGVSLGTKSQTGFGSATGVPAWIGSATTNVPGIWTGAIDELAVYNTALPAGSIAIHNSKFIFGTNTVAPIIVSQPASATLLAGGSPVLAASVTGTPPLSYQWKTNGTAVPGATSSSLTLSQTTTNSSATYTLTVSNPVGSTNSQPIVLTFIAPPSGYAARVMSDHPTAFWRLDESSGTNMFDAAGALNGTYSGAFTLGAPGAILGNPDTALTVTGGAKGEVPFSSTLNPAGPFTIEFWANPTAATTMSALASQFRSGSARNGIVFYHHFNGTGWEIQMGDGTGVHIDILSTIPVAAGNWYHVAAVYDGTNTATLYVDGENQGAGSGGFLPNPSAPFEIGIRNGAAVTFNGTLDEVAFYSYALTQAQLQSHVGLGLPLMTSISPSTNVIADSKPVGLPFDGQNANSSWLATSPDGTVTRNGVQQFTNTPAGQILVYGVYTNFDAPQGTMTFWMRSAGTVTVNNGNEAAIIFDRRPGGGAGGFVIVQEDSGTVVCQGANNIVPNLGTAASVSDGNWHHIAVAYDQTPGGFTAIYVDGALNISNVNVTGWSWTPGAELEFGQDSQFDGGYWRNYNGLLDDFRIYNRVLTSAEINSVYGSDALVDANALSLRFNFDGPPNGYGINWTYGTLQGAPAAAGPYSNLVPVQFKPFPVAPHPGTQRYFRALQ